MNKEELKNIFQFLENSEYSLDQDIINNHCIDWRGDFIGTSDIILFPKSTSSISKIIRACEKNHIPIIPQGGNTGLVGGSVPRKDKGEIILNLKNMNNIRKINLTDNSVIIESGCILEDLKKKLQEYDMELDELYEKLSKYGILQYVRSARIAVTKAPLFISEILKKFKKK